MRVFKVTAEEEVMDRMTEKQDADRFATAISTMAIPSMLPAWAGKGACAMNQCRVGRDSAATGTSSVNSHREERPI